MMELTYDPSIFAVGNIEQAKNIILTPEDTTTAARWAMETEYFADMIENVLGINPAITLLDYGCGIGRLAKALIERQGCPVLGVDISMQMRILAPSYVQSENFTACSQEMLDALIASGLRFDAAISVWVLQHCRAPETDLALIHAALHQGAPLFVVNLDRRAVPTRERGWVDDGIDLKELLAEGFEIQSQGRLLEEKTSPSIAQTSFWARCARR